MTDPKLGSRDDRFPGMRLRILGAECEGLTMEQVGLFLFDFAVAFELFRGVVESGGADRLTKWDLYRGHRRVASSERLAVEKLRMESPIQIVATTIALSGAGVTAIWAAIQAFERIYMLPLNREKAMLEVHKLRLEVRRLEAEAPHRVDDAPRLRSASEPSEPRLAGVEREVLPLLSQRHLRVITANELVRGRDEEAPHRDDNEDSQRVIETAERRLLRNPIQITQLELEFDRNVRPPVS